MSVRELGQYVVSEFLTCSNMVSSKHQMSKKNSHKSPPAKIQGVISINYKGVGYLKNPAASKDEELEIQNTFLNTALNRDEVEAVVNPKIKGRRLQGEVVSIIKRAKTDFVGTLEAVGQN